jgi:hypothetical protein
VAPNLAGRRNLLRAAALVRDRQPAAALQALRGVQGAAADRLRAQAIFASEEWQPAVQAYDVVLSQTDPAEPEDLARLALAAFRAGDAATLRKAADRRDRLVGTPWEGLVDMLLAETAPGPAGLLTGEEIARHLAAADKLIAVSRQWQTAPKDKRS